MLCTNDTLADRRRDFAASQKCSKEFEHSGDQDGTAHGNAPHPIDIPIEFATSLAPIAQAPCRGRSRPRKSE